MEEAPQTNLSLKSNETAQASLELLYHISRELVTVLDLRTVLERVVYLSMQTTGAISGTGNLTKSGPGKIILRRANSYSGNTTISNGILALAAGEIPSRVEA
ncbi:MAG: hypothetical protein HGA72_09870, partial [Chlorobiaceae bacterium]|nr:hypothetical protein [Chlorobiaceae bacterium]